MPSKQRKKREAQRLQRAKPSVIDSHQRAVKTFQQKKKPTLIPEAPAADLPEPAATDQEQEAVIFSPKGQRKKKQLKRITSKSQVEMRKNYNRQHSEIVRDAVLTFKTLNPERVASSKEKYGKLHPERVASSKEKYGKLHPERIASSYQNFRKVHPQRVASYKEKYGRLHAERVRTSKDKFKKKWPHIQRASVAKYQRSHADIVQRSKRCYQIRNPAKAMASRIRYTQSQLVAKPRTWRNRNASWSSNMDKMSNVPLVWDEDRKKRLKRQRKYIDLLPSREYSYVSINNRAVLMTGRVVAQQRMFRDLLDASKKQGLKREETFAKQVIQICINIRQARAEAIRRQANILKEIFDAIQSAVEKNPTLSLEDICGESGHRTSRGPYYHEFAYYPQENLPGSRSRPYAITRPSFLTASAKRMADFRQKIDQAMNRTVLTRLKWKLAKYDISRMERYIGRLSRFQAKEIKFGRKLGQETWPCDMKKCRYPENAVARLASMQSIFGNISGIRVVVADNRIDNCSKHGGHHRTWLTEQRQFTDRDKRFCHLPIIKRLDKKGHCLHCLPDNCTSNLLLLRQLEVHFKFVSKVVRHVYTLMELDRLLCDIDRALIMSDYEILEGLAKSHKSFDQELANPLGSDTALILCVEDRLSFLPYTKPFKKALEEMPTYDCASCGVLKYRRGVKQVFIVEPRIRPSRFRQNIKTNPKIHVGGPGRDGPKWNQLWADFYFQTRGNPVQDEDPDNDEKSTELFLCDMCYTALRSGKNHAPQSALNNMHLDPIPDELATLNEFEQICLQLAKCFQTVTRLGSVMKGGPVGDRLKVVRGQVLYYPLPLATTIEQLENAATFTAPGIHIIINSVPTKNLYIWSQLINLDKIRAGLRWLKKNHCLYANIDSNAWLLSLQKFMGDKNLDQEASDEEDLPSDVAQVCSDLATRGCLMKPMLKEISKDEIGHVLDACTIHPLEQRLPEHSDLKVYQMGRIETDKLDNRYKHLDEACFPVLYTRGRYGEGHHRVVNITNSDYVKNRLMHSDARFRRDHQFIFHCLWNQEMRQVAQGINQTLRNRKGYQNMPVNRFLQLANDDNLELNYNLSMMFEQMRGSPEYWRSGRNELLCMIRNLGSPTWFLTLSANEYHWEDMQTMLQTMNRDLKDVDQMRTSTLCSLDPVMCQNHFHERFTKFFNEVILYHKDGEGGPLGLVWDYFWRLEYQARGTPHYHILLWVKDAPRIGQDTEATVARFIQKHVTCRMPNPDSEPLLHRNVVNYQCHICNTYCKRPFINVRSKKGIKRICIFCRFGFPRPIRDVLVFRDIQRSMAQRARGQFHKRFYELPRKDNERRINDYSPVISLLWSVLWRDHGALANYICGYVTKKESCHSELWQDIDENKAVWQQLYAYAFRKLQNRECGIIEAIDRLLSQPLYQKSRQTIYLNVRMPADRSTCVKSHRDLMQLAQENPESDDIFAKNYLDHYYPSRPYCLEDMCYYDFRQWYTRCDPATKDLFINSKTAGVKRVNDPYLISHTVYKKSEDIEKYQYSLLLLFKKFRNETLELLDDSGKCGSIFLTELETNKRLADYHIAMQDQFVLLASKDDERKRLAEMPDTPAGTGDAEPLDVEPPRFDAVVDELLEAMGAKSDSSTTTLAEDVARLNTDQLAAYNSITKQLEDENASFKMFMSGAGGSGKSFLIHAIRKFMEARFGHGPDKIAMIICAPTGLAAFSVGGLTCHRVFKLPVQHGSRQPFFGLAKNERKALELVMKHTRLIVVDEISMVSSLTLIYMYKRMEEISRSDKPFGGRCLLDVGDLAQLSPVRAGFIFEPLPAAIVQQKGLGIGEVNLWLRDFNQYMELTINQRQRDDETYARILSALRFGQLTQEHVETLLTRLIDLDTSTPETMTEGIVDKFFELQAQDPETMLLVPMTAMVNKLNSAILTRIGRDIILVHATKKFTIAQMLRN